MSRADRAKEYFLKGYACSQAVVAAFSDCFDGEETEKLLHKIALPFGGGMSRLRLTCGALSGAAIVVGLLAADDGVNPENKREVYSIMQEVAARFKEENGALLCGELLTKAGVAVDTKATPEARSIEYYKKRPCAEIIYSCARVLEEILQNKGLIF